MPGWFPTIKGVHQSEPRGATVPLLSIPGANAYQVMPLPDGLFLPDYIADLLVHWHAYGETFALETVSGSNGYRLFVRFPRGDSKVRTHLEFKLGYARRSNDADWLRLHQTQSTRWSEPQPCRDTLCCRSAEKARTP